MNPAVLTKKSAIAVESDRDDIDTESLTGSTQRQASTTTLTRYGLWVLVFLGPLSAVANWLLPTPAPRPTSAPHAASAGEATVPAGCAAVFLRSYLTAGPKDAATLRRFFPHAPDVPAAAPTRTVTGIWPVQIQHRAPTTWSVTLAADVTVIAEGATPTTGNRYFQLALTGPPDAPAAAACENFTPVSLPAEVAGPAGQTAPELAYRDVVPSGSPLATTVADFLNAYLAGTGDLERYTTPGTRLRAVRPAPYRKVSIDSLTTHIEAGRGGERLDGTPPDGTRRRLLATVTATDASGSAYAMTYALSVSTRGSRWEIAGIDPAPDTATASAPSAQPTTTPKENR